MATRGKKEKEYPPMPANWMYKRGDVYMMDLNPYSGSEQGGIRPAIVVQNDDGNFYSNVLLVVPLTTQIKKRNMPTHFILHNRFLSAPSMAICESPRPADKSRVLSYLGHLSKYEMRQTSVYKGYKQDKIEMRGDRAEMSDFPLYLNTVAGGLDCRNQTIGGFSFVVKIYAVPVVEIIG